MAPIRSRWFAASFLALVLTQLVSLAPASAHVDSDISVRNEITSVTERGARVVVAGYVRVRDLTGTYTIARCTVVVSVGGMQLGQDSVREGFMGTARLRWKVRGDDPGGTATARIKHCHSFADA